jgi:hypothetical protein
MKTLKNKKISEIDDKIIMTEPTLLFPDYIAISKVFAVDSYYAGRIDLISLSVYNSADYVDQLLKFNGISNPFSINEGDTLFIPVNITSFKKFIKPSRSSKETQKEKFLKQRRMTEKDIKRFEYLQSIAQVEALPPNRLKTGQVNKDATSGPITDLNPSQV